MKEFKSNYYDIDYFANIKGKKYLNKDGIVEYWGYKNPTGEFLGAKDITNAWKTMFNPINLLDVGAGRGTVIAYAREQGISAEGFDFSEWAVSDEGRYARCKSEWLKLHDATNPWPYETDSFDLVVALDLMEHIYEEDLEFIIRELFRVSRKYIFLEIATVDGIREIGYILKKGEEIPLDTDARTWAGHTTVQTEEYWLNRLEHDDWFVMRDLVDYFFSLVPDMVVRNWLQNTVIILEKIE